MTTYGDQLFHLGGVPVGLNIPFGKDSKAFFVDPANGNSGNTGLSINDAMATVGQAFAKCTANRHDVVIYMAGSSGNTESAAVTWNKNFTHLIGIAAPTQIAQRARIFSNALTDSPFWTISATGCIFQNIYIFQGTDDSSALINVSVTGGRNYFGNVHFAGGGHVNAAIDGGASLLLDGAEECTFEHCTFGVDTITAATGMMAVRMDAETKRNVFRRCNFTMRASNGGAGFVEVVDNSGIDRYQIFDECLFLNMSATAMNSAFVIPAGMAVPRGPIVLKDCYTYGADDWDDQDRGIIKHSMGTRTTGGNAGILLASTES